MIADHPDSDTDVARAVARMRARYLESQAIPVAARLENLRRLDRAIEAHRGDLKRALTADFRKSPDESEFTEIVLTRNELRFARSRLAEWVKPRSVATPLSLFGARSEVRYEPKGVVLILAPWNYPVYLTLAPLIAAIAAGNRVIVRPSEKAAATRDVLLAIVAEAFDPTDVRGVGGDSEVANALLAQPFDHIFFTGSPRVGRTVMRAAAEHLASVTLELGGKSPAIVTRDADIAHAARRIAWGKYLNAGQTCVAPDYALVDRAILPSFLTAMRTSIAAMYGSNVDERAATPDFARLIDDAAFARVDRAIEAAVALGARVEIGGERDATTRYIAPTVMTNVPFDADLLQDEIFAPVLPVVGYTALDEALAIVRAQAKPLALYVFSRRGAVVEQIIAETSAGGTLVNDVAVQLANPNLPFGGVGQSGIGSYHGHHGFLAFSHERAVMRQSSASLVPLLSPPFNRVSRLMTALLERL